jgi:hypothetical protein
MLEIMVDLLGMVLRTLLWMLLWFLFFLFVVLLPLIFEKWSVASLATPVSYQLFWLIHAYLSLLFAGMGFGCFRLLGLATPRQTCICISQGTLRGRCMDFAGWLVCD